jgi:uncharacterized protein YkwD
LAIGVCLGVSLAASASPVPQGPQLTEEWVLLDADTGVKQPAAGTVSNYHAPQHIQQAVDRLNEYRRIAGVPPVELDARLTRGCQAHARYLAVNAGHPSAQGLGAHEERPGLAGYSEEGRDAGTSSDIAWRRSPAAGVDACMATLYHRIPMLRPNLRRIGIGFERGIMVTNVITGMVGNEDRPVAFPAANQASVPTVFPNEIPDPIPATAPHPAGYPITLQFPTYGAEVGGVRAQMNDDSGRPVAFHLSDPSRPAADFPQQNTVCLIPARPLTPGTTYRVSISATYEGKPVAQSWTFTTEGTRRASSGESRKLVAAPRLAHR